MCAVSDQMVTWTDGFGAVWTTPVLSGFWLDDVWHLNTVHPSTGKPLIVKDCGDGHFECA